MDSISYSGQERRHGRTQSQRYSFLNSTASALTPMGGRTLDIALTCFYMTLPLLVLTAVLIGLVYRHRVAYTEGPFPNLAVKNLGNDSAGFYYVDLSATFLIFIASWMSSLAPVLVGFAITLSAYRIGEEVLRDTRDGKPDDLFTPYQLSLTLRFVNGGTWSALWCWFLYMLGWGRQRQALARPLKQIVLITIFTAGIGLAVFGADTWLHIATKTVNFTNVSDVTSQTHPFSFGLLSPNCTATNNSIVALAAAGYNCGLDIYTDALVDGTEPIRTLNNISNTITVQSNGPNPDLQFLGIAESARDPKFDFAASSYGMLTQCRAITRECNMQSDGNISYNCENGAFKGAVFGNTYTSSTFQLGQFANEDLSDTAMNGTGIQNPYYTTLAAFVEPPANVQTDLSEDPDILSPNGGLAFVLLCTSTVYDIQYSLVENNVTQLSQTPSNTSVTNIWAMILAETLFGISNLNTAVSAGVQFSNTAQELADAFALSLSKVSLASGVQALVKVPSPQIQQRTSILVAQLPFGPLFALIGANLSFVILGVGLAILAWTAPKEAREAQSRLSITGLVAERFEGLRARAGVRCVENMFDEYQGVDGLRIGIDKCEQGGYAFKTIEKDMELSKNAYMYENPVRWSNAIPDSERAGWI